MRERETHDSEKVKKIAAHYKAILEILGENPDREGLLKTPERAAKALLDCTCGYSQTAENVVGEAVFEHSGSRAIIVRDIEFYSFCEHHILPFFGTVSIAYLPKGKMIGLSKLARVVDVFARRLQVQERLTAQICEAVDQILPNEGVMVLCKAQHLCMKMRGVEKQDSSTLTIETCGRFETDSSLCNEVLRMIESR